MRLKCASFYRLLQHGSVRCYVRMTDPETKTHFLRGNDRYTVEPRNNSPAFQGSPSIKVNTLRSQMIVFNVISPLFKGYPEIKVKNLQS